MTAAVRTSREIGTGFIRSVVAADDGLRRFGGAVNRQVSEIQLTFDVVQRPTGVGDSALMTGIRPDGGISVVDHGLRLVVDAGDESAPAAHQELPIPRVGEQQRKPDLRPDHTGHPAVRRADRTRRRRRHRDRLGDLHVRQPQHLQMGALRVLDGRLSGGRRVGHRAERTTRQNAANTSSRHNRSSESLG